MAGSQSDTGCEGLDKEDNAEASARAERLAELPAPGAKRWVIRRKAAVVEAIDFGDLSISDACERYDLSAEEINSWRKLIDAHGVRGLRSTRLQQYRKPDV
jgi:hypothetical protein